MSYHTHNYQTGAVLTAAQLNEMDAQIAANETALTGKQDALVFDATPTAGSTNPVTSDGTAAAVAAARAYADSAASAATGDVHSALALFMEDLQTLLGELAYTTAAHHGAAVSADAQAVVRAIDGTPTPTSYRVTGNLTHVSSANGATSVAALGAYSTTLTADAGYAMDAVSVTMGGVDVTASAYTAATGAVSIASVTGNIVITATASAALVLLTGTGTSSGTTAIPGLQLRDDAKRLSCVALSGAHEINNASSHSGTYYPALHIEPGTSSLTFRCEPNAGTNGTVYCAINIIVWNETSGKWDIVLDVGWSNHTTWTKDLTNYNDGSYYITVAFKNTGDNDTINQLSLSDVTFTFQ